LMICATISKWLTFSTWFASGAGYKWVESILKMKF
jgi:hypothetical protein